MNLLKKTGIFSQLTGEELEILAGNSELREYGSEETVFETGDPASELFVVSSGEVSVSRITEEGKSLQLARLIEGDMFGELEFFQREAHNASAKAGANGSTVLLQFPKEGLNFQDLLSAYPAISARILHAFISLIAGRIRRTNNLITDNSPVIQELKRQVYGDTLTGLFNKTYLDEQLHTFLKNPGEPVSLLMIKPDNFKWINDNCGHDAGDETIRVLAGAYAEELGERGTAVRYMGNEFAFVFPSLDRNGAHETARRLQELVGSLDLSAVTGSGDFRLTASVGIAVFPLHARDAAALIAEAHELPLLGRARGGGKILFPEDKEAAGGS